MEAEMDANLYGNDFISEAYSIFKRTNITINSLSFALTVS